MCRLLPACTRARDPGFLRATLRQKFAQLRATLDLAASPPFAAFCRLHRALGFRHRQIRYVRRAARVYAPDDLAAYAAVLGHMLARSAEFQVVFLDESSVCPANFQRRSWFVRRQPAHVSTRIRYEKLMLLGAMTRSRVVGLQLVESGFCAKLFANFVHQVVLSLRRLDDEHRLVVLVLDNAPAHRSPCLTAVCDALHCVAVFAPPGLYDANAIELLWGHVKRPLRALTDYPQLRNKQDSADPRAARARRRSAAVCRARLRVAAGSLSADADLGARLI